MKNALIPVVTFIGLDLAPWWAGPSSPRRSSTGRASATRSSSPSASATGRSSSAASIIIVFMVMIINLLVDISYAFLDPRIRYGRAGDVR